MKKLTKEQIIVIIGGAEACYTKRFNVLKDGFFSLKKPLRNAVLAVFGLLVVLHLSHIVTFVVGLVWFFSVFVLIEFSYEVGGLLEEDKKEE